MCLLLQKRIEPRKCRQPRFRHVALGLCFEDAALNGVGAQESSVSITTKHFRDCTVVHRKPLCDREQREAGFFTTLGLLAGVDATARTDRSLMSSAESGLSAVEAARRLAAYRLRLSALVLMRDAFAAAWSWEVWRRPLLRRQGGPRSALR